MKFKIFCTVILSVLALSACYALTQPQQEPSFSENSELAIFLTRTMGSENIFYSADGSVWYSDSNGRNHGIQRTRITKCVPEEEIPIASEEINKYISIEPMQLERSSVYTILSYKLSNLLPHDTYLELTELPCLQAKLDGQWYTVPNSHTTVIGSPKINIPKNGGSFENGVFLYQDSLPPVPAGHYRLFFKHHRGYYSVCEFLLECENDLYRVIPLQT